MISSGFLKFIKSLLLSTEIPALFRYVFFIALLSSSIGLLSLQAQHTDSTRITVQFDGQSLEQIFSILEEKSQISVFYKSSWLTGMTYSGNFEDQTILSILSEILAANDLSFAVYRNSPIIIAPSELLSKEFNLEYYRMKDLQNSYLAEMNNRTNVENLQLGSRDSGTSPDGYRINGVVIDKLEGQRLTGVTVIIKDQYLAISTNATGEFEITLTEGYHLAEVRMVGYDSRTFSLNILGPSEWNIELLPEATKLDEVLVRSSADNNNVTAAFAGVTTLNPVELREMPVFLGEPDVIKSILTLPGISTVGEGASGFNVRGGNIDQNLILQDNALIFNSSHAMGFFNIFNPDAIKGVTLYKGHIPAQYGGRVSSVLDVQLKGNNYESLKLNGGVGFLASRLMLETPIIKGKTSLLIGGRVAYSDWILNFVNNREVQQSSLDFYDFNIKISQRLGENGTLALSAYNSHDYFSYSDQFGFSWDMSNFSLLWNQTASKSIFSEFSVSGSLSSNSSFQPSGVDGFTLENGMKNFKVKEDVLFTGIQRHTLNAGFEVNAYIPEDEMLKPYNEESTVLPYDGAKDRGTESVLYLNDQFDITERLSLSAGLRFIYYYQPGPATVYHYENGDRSVFDNMIDSTTYSSGQKVISYNGLDPRVSLRYMLDVRSSVKLSYNRINQFIHLISNTTAALPIDFWQMSNTWFRPLIADNYSAGYFRNFRLNQWETSVEVYYRNMQNLVEYKDFPELYLNPHLETEILSGDGKGYGMELFVKKKTGKFNGWLSYTFSRSLVLIDDTDTGETVNSGEWFPSKFDQPHNLNIVGNLHLNKTNTFSFNFTYSTGRPLTGPESNYSLDGYLLPNYSARNEFRLPDYHRLDVSYTIERGKLRTKRFKDSFTLSIYNVYARKNAYSIYFRRDLGINFHGYKLAVIGTMIPSITYNFQF